MDPEISAAAPSEDAAGKELGKLWTYYKVSGDSDAKNELLLHYMPIVRRIVRRMMPKYNSYNEYDDLVNSGMIGLIDAVEKFDLKHNVKFETYAVQRIRGEILDYMRSQDWAPSSLRKKINTITNAYETLETRLGAQPTEKMISEEIDVPEEQIQKIMAQTHVFNLVNFEDAMSAAYSVTDIPCDEDEIPENIVVNKDMKGILAGLIESLPEKERLVITLYYYEELMFKEIAEILEVSESRISQIHSKVLGKLRSGIEKIT